MKGRKKIAIAVITALLLITLVPLLSNTNTMAITYTPLMKSTAQETLKQPVFGDLISQQLSVYLSAIENSTDVVASSLFNQSFFNLPDPMSFPGLASIYVSLQAHVLEEGVNATAPHTSYLFATGVGGLISGPFGLSSFNQTLGVVNVQMFGSDIAACNQTIQEISAAFIESLSVMGLNFTEFALQFTVVPFPEPLGGPLTVGYLMLSSLNDSVTTYNYLVSLIPEDTLAKNIAEKESNEKYVAIMDQLFYMAPPLTWATGVNVGIVLENQIGVKGDIYNYTPGTLFEPDNKIIKGPVTIEVSPPVNSNVTNAYGFWLDGMVGIFQPSFYYSSSFDVNADDFYITYTLEPSVPCIVVDYDMSNWKLNPGENGTLYLTIRNVGTSKAYNIGGSIYLYSTDVMSFLEGMPWPGMVSFYFDEMEVGQTEILEFGVAANSIGVAQFSMNYIWRRASNGLINFMNYLMFEYHVGMPGPYIITSLDYSNWVLNPNDVVSALYTIRNVGTETATNVSSFGTPVPPIVGTVIDSNITLPEIYEPLMYFGDIPAGSSLVANITMRYDMNYFGSVHTGLGPVTAFGSQIYYNDGMYSFSMIPNPILMPGVRPSDAIYIEVAKTPDIVSINPGDEVSINIKVKNLGLTEQTVYVLDWYLEDVFELISGSNIMKMNIESGSSITMTYKLRAKTTATLRLPQPAIGTYGTAFMFAQDLLGTPLERTTSNTAYVEGDFLVDAVEEAGVEISGNTPAPTTLNIWGDSQPPGAEPPAGVTPLSYIRVEANETFTATLVFHYNEENIPEGITEENLAVFLWDEENQVWVELPSIVDTELNTVTVEVSGSSYFMLGAKTVVEQVFQGFAILRIDGKWYMGDGKLYLSEDSIRVEVEGQSASWSIYKHLEQKFIELYFGKGELGNIDLIIYQRGETQSALAVGRDVFFCGSN